MNSEPALGPAMTPAPAPVYPTRFFGVGTAGVKILQEVIGRGLPPAACVAFDSNSEALATSSAAIKLVLETQLLKGMGTGGDPERGRAGAQAHETAIRDACREAKVIFVITGLGGGTGTGAAPLIAQVAKAGGALVLAFAVAPFDCEGTLRAETAGRGLQELNAVADLVVGFSNQKALSIITEATALVDTFKVSNSLLADSLHTVGRMFAGEGVMGLPFLDLCLLIKERTTDPWLATGTGTGPARAREALERALASPMLGSTESLQTARMVAICVSGGPDLTMLEVNRIMEQLQTSCPEVPATMGAVIHRTPAGSSAEPSPSDALTVALLVAPHVAAAPVNRVPEESVQRSSSVSGSLEKHLLNPESTARPQSRFVAPAPSLPQEKMEQIFARQSPGRPRKSGPKLRQAQLPLEIVSRGRFDKSEPTIHKGEDLDVPTYIRRGVVLN